MIQESSITQDAIKLLGQYKQTLDKAIKEHDEAIKRANDAECKCIELEIELIKERLLRLDLEQRILSNEHAKIALGIK